MDFCVIIPARYNATRLPAKLLADINGKPLIQHTFENAISSGAKRVVIATDDERILSVAEDFGASVCMTAKHHPSGTARIAEALTLLNIDEQQTIVNLQADEPMLSGRIIAQVAHNLADTKMPMATLCAPIKDKNQYLDPNCVKVVFDKFGKALYFSRAPIPFFRTADFNQNICFKHIGIYAYKADFVQKYLTLTQSDYEKSEQLEQLSVLAAGFDIHITLACEAVGYGVDTKQDLNLVRRVLK